jgi:hypothetical protein
MQMINDGIGLLLGLARSATQIDNNHWGDYNDLAGG